MLRILLGFLLMGLVTSAARSEGGVDPRQALQPFNDLIGSWKATGSPEGTREEKQRGFWIETMSWEWQFKGKDAWLVMTIDKGKHYTRGELRVLPEKDTYQLTLTTPARETQVFRGTLAERRLTLTRTDPKGETHQLVFNLLHNNRFVYRSETRVAGKTLFKKIYEVGATKEGVAFAGGDNKPECIVSGGLGTMPISYKGQTYYVCCSGCRSAFFEEPEKYIKEFEEAQKKKKK